MFVEDLDLEIRKLELKEKLPDDPRVKAEIKKRKAARTKLLDCIQKRCSRSVETATIDV